MFANAIISVAMKRTLNTIINRSKSEKNDEYYTPLAAIGKGFEP